MGQDQEALASAQNWIKLLRSESTARHTTELASSSLVSLADTLQRLLHANTFLEEACRGYEKRIAEMRDRLREAEKKLAVRGKTAGGSDATT